ncbi:tyrosine-type recombinase/integrase [Paenibacillus pinistramenti]|uniref:tyrosine-type recombinase/integrase n=1 Tax=Paenibacillus pinistramenti TaxID=1768003 RepID=UPI0011085D04|nr:tyrosine-type recombinase/integrase [Paenibacillus pinistramenti]
MEGHQREPHGRSAAADDRQEREKSHEDNQEELHHSQEVETLLAAFYALPTHWRLYFTGVMLGGFRRGELLAVEWPNVDYEQGAIYIENQITFDEDGNKIEAEVKTEESEGWVAMPKWYMEELRRYEREWGEAQLQELGRRRQAVYLPRRSWRDVLS